MKKIRKIFPVLLMIWPYLFILLTILPGEQPKIQEFLLTAYLPLTVVVYGLNIWNACTYPSEESECKLAFYDMVIKLAHIPFYIGVFVIGICLVFAMVVPALLFISPILILFLAVIDADFIRVWDKCCRKTIQKRDFIKRDNFTIYHITFDFCCRCDKRCLSLSKIKNKQIKLFSVKQKPRV